jgi:hypothetical protein
MDWTLDQIVTRLKEIEKKGYISVPIEVFRHNEGVVGQLLEREFNIKENNLSLRDLGTFELKGMRMKSATLTLCHKKPEEGLSPLQIFDRFGYIRASNRNSSIQKKKLFTTVTGTRQNNLGLMLKSSSLNSIDMLYHGEFICRWFLGESLKKIDRIILVYAETEGKTGTAYEKFHYVEANLFKDLKDLGQMVKTGVIVIDFCIDQKVGDSKGPHDRGPHIRIPKSKLHLGYEFIEKLL